MFSWMTLFQCHPLGGPGPSSLRPFGLGMGGGGSTMQQQSEMAAYEQHHAQPFMDMNMIFNRGIPKMWQVADDMNRMTNYIMDLRNMTFGLMIISAIGVIGFLILRAVNKRSSRRKRRYSRTTHEDGPTLPRYYQPQYMPEPWDRPKYAVPYQLQSTFSHHSMEEKKALDAGNRNSPEERKTLPNGTLTYKPYNSISAPPPVVREDIHGESDESRRMEDSFSSGSRATTVNPMLMTSSTPPTTHKVAPV